MVLCLLKVIITTDAQIDTYAENVCTEILQPRTQMTQGVITQFENDSF
jgi:hypothetical protein